MKIADAYAVMREDVPPAPMYLFLAQMDGEWHAATKDGHLCVVRRDEVTKGSPLIRADHPKSTVPLVDLLDGHRTSA